MAFVQAVRADESMAARALARQVQERFGVHVHPRSIERVLRRAKKNHDKRAAPGHPRRYGGALRAIAAGRLVAEFGCDGLLRRRDRAR
jgi:hypothetical protein